MAMNSVSGIIVRISILSCILHSVVPGQTREEDVSPTFLTELLYMYDELPGVTKQDYYSPTAMVASPDGKLVYIAEYTARQVAFFDIASGTITKEILLPKEPSGIAISPDGSLLYVTCSSEKRPSGIVCVLDAATGAIIDKFSAGHSARAPVLSPDGSVLYLCNQFKNCVTVFDVATRKVTKKIPVAREPVDIDITPDGNFVVVANHIPNSRTDIDTVQTPISIIDTKTHTVVASILLANGAHSLIDIVISPEGKYAYITVTFARFEIPPTDIQNGWITANGIAIIDVVNRKLVNCILMDDMGSGAANAWGIDCSKDGKKICVTHAGTNEVCVIDAVAMHAKLATVTTDQSKELTFAKSFKQRKVLNVKGPRSVSIVGDKAYVSGYFSGNIDIIDMSTDKIKIIQTASLGTEGEETLMRRGEYLFYNANICFQGWMSCHSCHPYTRTDGLNWDLLNDGTGNPKIVKSMLLSHITPPVMVSGVRDSAEIAVRAGIEHILFATPNEDDAMAIDEFMKKLRPMPGPYLEKGKLSAAAKRGKDLYYNKLRCAKCHPPPLYTDLDFHDVGTRGPKDQRDEWDTPTLIENWRNAPFLHDGRHLDIKESIVLPKHSIAHILSESELKDLIEFNLSL